MSSSVYAILILRTVGSYGPGFVPRLSVTVASLLGIAAAALLVVFLHHVSLMIQVSHVTAGVARETLSRTDLLYSEGYRDSAQPAANGELLASWRSDPPGQVRPGRPGYVQRVNLTELADGLEGRAARIAVLVCPGDFVSAESPIAEIWPAGAAEDCPGALHEAVHISSERDLQQDIDFGIRQLTDIALKALSPGINDPMTAITCVGYLRSILVRLTERAEPPGVHRFAERELTVITRTRRYDEYLESLLQINRYVRGDAWVAGEMLEALHACATAARRTGADRRLRSIRDVAETIAGQAARQVGNERDARRIEALQAAVEAEVSGQGL